MTCPSCGDHDCAAHEIALAHSPPRTRAELEAIERQRDALLAVCRALWADRDAEQSDQAACRRLYNAWRDMGDALRQIDATTPGRSATGSGGAG